MLKDVIHPKLSYKITGLCFTTHNELGRFAKEKQYADRLEQLLKINRISYKRESYTPFDLKENKVTGNIADFIIENKIIVECKAKKFITKEGYNQTQRYLKATKIKLCLLVNFRCRYLKPKRIINYSYHSHAFARLQRCSTAGRYIRIVFMKKDIHPQYYTDAKVACACGNSFSVGSTVKEIHVEICSMCHPFYTGKQKLVDTARRVEKFQTRLSKKQSPSKVQSKKAKLAIRAKKKSAKGATAKAGQGPVSVKKKEAAKKKTEK